MGRELGFQPHSAASMFECWLGKLGDGVGHAFTLILSSCFNFTSLPASLEKHL
jgi:hypothetical protein